MDIDALFEKTKIQAFLYSEAALLGTILGRFEFKWDKSIPTASVSTDKKLRWNPDWFESLPENTRVTILLHELWHVARLHALRVGNRNPKIWNMACDFRINNDLIADRYSFKGTEGLFDPSLDDPERLTEEEIYDILMKDAEHISKTYTGGDLEYADSEEEEQDILQTVQSAEHYARSCGSGSSGDIEKILAQIMKPKIPWRRLLRQYFIETCKEDYSWKRPNRRYEDMYLPSMQDGERLTSLNYYVDTSGSISTEMLKRFNSELRTIWQDLKPSLIRVINFDCEIQNVIEIRPEDNFDAIEFQGRGGTSLRPVYDHIAKTKPKASIIFSDLFCRMPKEKPKSPVIWIVVANPKASPPYGKAIHLTEEDINGTKRT